jgi:anti-sigma B factor antagonist
MDISCQTLEPDIVLIRLNGRLDARTSPGLKSTLQSLLEEGHHRLIVDLAEVPFIDSSGLVALVSGLRLAQENQGEISLSGIKPQAQAVFRLTRLDRVFPIHPTFDDARRSLI